MGFLTALDGCFKIHQLNHAHRGEVTGGKQSYGTVEHGLDDWRAPPEILPAAKRRPRLRAREWPRRCGRSAGES
jgi:enoyl-CoA hydratase